ncbi:MAG: glycosyltransferase family 4 protein [Saprospiraceae bacterium]|nr:glycosyltransferase family 4 protein [Saprospiraceae bacterium]
MKKTATSHKIKRLKIAVFSGSIPSTTFIENLIHGISESHKVLLFGTLKRPYSYDSKSIYIYETPKSHWTNLLYSTYRLLVLALKRPKDVLKLFKEIRKYSKVYNRWIWFTKFLPIVLYKPDILHIQWAKNLEFYYFLKRDFKIKIILSLRGAHINYSPIVDPNLAAVYKNTFPKIDAFHAVSKAIGIEAEKYHAEKEKIKVIHSPIPQKFIDAFKPYKKRSNKNIHLVSIGRTHWIKGYPYAIEAISILRQKGLPVTYSIIGVDHPNEALSFQIKQHDLQEFVNLIPSISQDALIEQLPSYDAIILSSLKEGIANVVLEAMAIGLPVISTDCGGMNEVIKPMETGFLVPMRNPEALANAVVELIESSEHDLQLMTQNANDIVKFNFKASDKIKEFLELYESTFNN